MMLDVRQGVKHGCSQVRVGWRLLSYFRFWNVKKGHEGQGEGTRSRSHGLNSLHGDHSPVCQQRVTSTQTVGMERPGAVLDVLQTHKG